MTRTSQTETAVLGGLSVMPMTGYALRQAILEVLGHFWSESFGQIYPALARLEADGLIEREGAAGSAPYAITERGLERLRALLAEPIHHAPPRNGLLLRLFFGRHLGGAACRQLVEAAKADALEQLGRFAAIRAEIAGEDATRADQPYWLLTVSAGEHAARAVLSWADETIALLDALTPDREETAQ